MGGYPVRVASVGIGRWSDMLADSIHGKSALLRIVACYSRDEGKRGRFAGQYGCRTAGSYDEVLNDPEVEGLVLTTPHSLHAEHTIAAAQAGKHVFVEKPFTLTAAEGRKAAEACRRAGVVLAVGHSRRRQGSNRKIKALLEAKELGRPVQAECNLSGPSALGYTPGAWRASRAESPAGGMAALGIHHVDTLQYLLGPIARVMAFSKRLVAPVDLDDSTTVLLEFEVGPLGFLGTSVMVPKVLYLNLYGTEADAYSEGEGAALFLQKKGSEEKVPVPIAGVDILREELEDFARAVRREGPYEVTPDEAIRAVAVMDAVLRSAESGRAVEVKDCYA